MLVTSYVGDKFETCHLFLILSLICMYFCENQQFRVIFEILVKLTDFENETKSDEYHLFSCV